MGYGSVLYPLYWGVKGNFFFDLGSVKDTVPYNRGIIYITDADSFQ